MTCSLSRRLVATAGLVGGLLCEAAPPTIVLAASSPVTAPITVSGKRWVTFDFAGLDASGDLQAGKPVKLAITLGGVAQGQLPLVAVCESIHFQRQIVRLEPDTDPLVMKATAILQPISPGKLTVSPRAARIQVTFARSHNEKKLQRVITRIVYVTLGEHELADDANALPLLVDGELYGEDTSQDQDEVQADANPVTVEHLLEEDLLPLPEPERGQAYWRQLSRLLSRSWSRTARRVRQSPSSETVRVRFRLYPSGRAQLIQIEKGSGAREIDEAGIHAVVHAQPFPPFSDDLGSEPIDVHVRMRTGVRTGAPRARSGTALQPLSRNETIAMPKK